jgi:ADP-heptose:LPS heptosyltransferase
MFKVIISPYSKPLRNGKENPKNYPYWPELVKGLKEKDMYVIQIGVRGEKEIEGVDEVLFNKPLKELVSLLNECNTWISVDNFFQHLAYFNGKPGIAIFGQSDPEIFGHKENINILKDRKYLRVLQFDIWERAECNNECFVEPAVIIDRISKGA